MRTVIIPKFTQDLSEEMVRNYVCDLEGYFSLDDKLKEFARLDAYYFRNFLFRRGHFASNIRMLEAHGCLHQEKGYFYVDLQDGNFVYSSVDSWLDVHDEEGYDALFVACCNSAKTLLRVRKTLIVYPLGEYFGALLARETLYGERVDAFQIVKPSL